MIIENLLSDGVYKDLQAVLGWDPEDVFNRYISFLRDKDLLRDEFIMEEPTEADLYHEVYFSFLDYTLEEQLKRLSNET